MRPLLIAAILLPSLVGAQPSADSGAVQMTVVVEGIAVDAKGKPIAGRTIFTFPVASNGQIARFMGITAEGKMLALNRTAHPSAKSDAQGRFTIRYASSLAVTRIGEDAFILGTNYSGLAVGIMPGENIAALPLDSKPTFLKALEGDDTKAKFVVEGKVLRIRFGKVMARP